MHCQSADPAAQRARQWGAPSQHHHHHLLSPGSEGLMNDYFSLCNTTGCWFKGHPSPHSLTFDVEYPQWSMMERRCPAPKWNRASALLLDGDLWVSIHLGLQWLSDTYRCYMQFIVFMNGSEHFRVDSWFNSKQTVKTWILTISHKSSIQTCIL